MKNFFLTKILGWIAIRLDGYKTTIGGVGLIITGVLGILGNMFPDQNLPVMSYEQAFATLASGFTVLGIGGKLEKLKKTAMATDVKPE